MWVFCIVIVIAISIEFHSRESRVEFCRHGGNWMLILGKISGRVTIIDSGSINLRSSGMFVLRFMICGTTTMVLRSIVYICIYTLSPSPTPSLSVCLSVCLSLSLSLSLFHPPHRWSFTLMMWHLSLSVWWLSWPSSTLSSTCFQPSLSFLPPCLQLRM